MTHLQKFPINRNVGFVHEGWGQFQTVEVAKWTKKHDPTRLVDNASGWHDFGAGDVCDAHAYPGLVCPKIEETRAAVLGEFGGVGLEIRENCWHKEHNYGYRMTYSADELRNYYRILLRAVRPMIDRGLCAAVYTQTTDYGTEVNGFLRTIGASIKWERNNVAENQQGFCTRPSRKKLRSFQHPKKKEYCGNIRSKNPPKSGKRTNLTILTGWKVLLDLAERGLRRRVSCGQTGSRRICGCAEHSTFRKKKTRNTFFVFFTTKTARCI